MYGKEIILADNQDITRIGMKTVIRSVLRGEEDILIKDVAKLSELEDELKKSPYPIVVLDYNLFDIANVDHLLRFAKRFPAAHWVLFSTELPGQLILRISKEPNFSIVLKDDSTREVTSALHCAIIGSRFLCHQATNAIISMKDNSLTATETEILRQIALGKSPKEIASERCSSIHTIHTHKKNIFRKIDVNTIHEATRYAVSTGIVEMVEYYI